MVSLFVSLCIFPRVAFVVLSSARLQVLFGEVQNAVRVDMGGHQSARGLKRRKLNAVDADLADRYIDTVTAQIVAILKTCLMSMPKLVFVGDDAMHYSGFLAIQSYRSLTSSFSIF